MCGCMKGTLEEMLENLTHDSGEDSAAFVTNEEAEALRNQVKIIDMIGCENANKRQS